MTIGSIGWSRISYANSLSSKTFVTIGDSITARDRQMYGSTDGKPNIGYQQILKKSLGFGNYINLGISGSTVARGTDYLRGLTKLVNDFYFGDIDFIIISAGTNDFGLGVPLGDKSELLKKEPNRYNFYGAYVGMVSDLKRNNPNVEIYLWTPTIRNLDKFENGKNKAGHSLEEYRDVIIEIGKHFDIEVVDMYNIPEMTQETLPKYTTPEGLHLNNKGYELVAKKFGNAYVKNRFYK